MTTIKINDLDLPNLHAALISDAGCEVSVTCLGCPLSQCRFDDLAWYNSWRKRARYLLIGEAIELDGLTVQAAATRFGVTIRTAYRSKRWHRVGAKTLSPVDLAVFLRFADDLELAEVA